MTVSTAGFIAFIRDQMQIDPTNLPDSSPSIQFSLDLAVAVVNQQLACVPIGVQPGLTAYDLAVYNLAADNIINFAVDVPGGGVDSEGRGFFESLRVRWGIGQFQAGVVQSSSDQGTSVSLLVQDYASTFTLSDLQNLKTPYGRAYLALAQRTGTLWGVS
jgi:hypothetical protein